MPSSYHLRQEPFTHTPAMCGDPNSRIPTIDSGDLLAIIHPTSSFAGARLRLSNKVSGPTQSYFDSATDHLSIAEPCTVRIHKFGTPSGSSASSADTSPGSASSASSYFDTALSNPVLHTFALQMSGARQLLDQRLNLGVCGEGLVGRTVSVVGREGEVLGEGVIGWC